MTVLIEIKNLTGKIGDEHIFKIQCQVVSLAQLLAFRRCSKCSVNKDRLFAAPGSWLDAGGIAQRSRRWLAGHSATQEARQQRRLGDNVDPRARWLASLWVSKAKSVHHQLYQWEKMSSQINKLEVKNQSFCVDGVMSKPRNGGEAEDRCCSVCWNQQSWGQAGVKCQDGGNCSLAAGMDSTPRCPSCLQAVRDQKVHCLN